MLDQALVAEVLILARAGGADFSELLVEDSVNTNLRLHQGEVKDAGGGNLFAKRGKPLGVGIHAHAHLTSVPVRRMRRCNCRMP